MTIRRAIEADAAAMVAILEGIARERIYSAITTPWSVDEQCRYLAKLSDREAVHVADCGSDGIVGYQPLELWAPTLESMAHVAQIGTFLAPEWRRRGVGHALFERTVEFAREHGFGKFVAQVRASNAAAQAFYARLGFRECGRLARQVRIGTIEEDELLMEYFL